MAAVSHQGRSLSINTYANVAKRVINLRAKGESFRAIATQLDMEGEVTREGRPFAAETIRRIYERGKTDQ